MKQIYTLKRTLSALPLFLLLGIFAASCSKDDNETSNPEETNQETTDPETGNEEETDQNTENPIPEGAHIWEYYSINEDGESVTVASELSDYPYNNDIYEVVYIPSTVNIDGKDYRVTSIRGYAFCYCYSLTSISLPKSLTSIGWYAFLYCRSLTSISIPEGVTSIGWYAFYGCSSLTSISIPEGVTSIGYQAFYNCSSLTSVTSYAEKVPELVSDVFWNVPTSKATLYVPASALEDYKAAVVWKNFGKILPLEDIPAGISSIKAGESNAPYLHP